MPRQKALLKNLENGTELLPACSKRNLLEICRKQDAVTLSDEGDVTASAPVKVNFYNSSVKDNRDFKDL
jgi:hypothetical protein